MADDLGALVAKLQADVSDLKKGLRESREDLRSFRDLAQDAGAKVKQALSFVGVAVGIYEIASALKEFVVSAAMVGARTETLNIAMEQVGKTYGVSAASLKFYVDELKGAGITTQESMTAVTKALTTGIPLDQLKDLATRARDIAVVAGINTSEALNRMMQGIISGEQETLRRLMIQVGHTDDIYTRFAATLGKTKEELNSVEKTQAMLNEVMHLSAGFAGTAAAADASVGKQIQSMARFAEEAKNSLWALFGPVMSAAVQEMTKAWKDLKTWADKNRESLYDWGEKVAAWIKWATEAASNVITWAIANAQLLQSLVELYVISKVMTWVQGISLAFKGAGAAATIFTGIIQGLVPVLAGAATTMNIFAVDTAGVATAMTVATTAGRALNAMMLTLLPSIVAAAGALAAYGAYQTIKKPASLDQMSPEETQLLGEAWVLTPPKKTTDEFEGYERPLPGGVLGYLSPEERKAKAQTESETAQKKAMENAPKAPGKEGKAGAKETTDNLLAPMLAMYKVKREAELAEAQNSLDLLKSTNDKKRAELEKDLAEGVIDGQTYYQRLQELQQQETDASLAMIEKKKAAQAKAYKESLTEIEADPKMSDEAKSIARQKLAVENQKTVSKLALEGAQAKLDGEVKVTNELKRQVEVQKQYNEKTQDLNIETSELVGAISQQEATLQKQVLEWQRTKQDAIDAGGYTPEFAAAGEANLGAKQADTLYGGYASSITSGISSIVDALVDGGSELKEAANSMFKSLLNESLKSGLQQLQQLLVSGFKSVFGAAGGAISSAVMGVIGLVGTLLTSSSSSSSYSASSVTSSVTSSEAVRGVIAGDTTVAISEVSDSLSEAVAPHLGILRQIEENTRNSGGGGSSQINVTIQGVQEAVRETLEAYFRDYLLTGAKG
jgi:hypothetical protein